MKTELLEQPSNEQPKPEFHIDSDDKAEWLLRKLGNLEAEAQRVKAQADNILKGIENDRTRLMEHFGVELEDFCRAKLDGKRTKTAKFLQGSCSLRTVPGGLRLMDETAAIVYAKCANLAILETVEKLNTAAYREHAERTLKETGELLPGVTVVEERETFNIRFPKLNAQASDFSEEA